MDLDSRGRRSSSYRLHQDLPTWMTRCFPQISSKHQEVLWSIGTTSRTSNQNSLEWDLTFARHLVRGLGVASSVDAERAFSRGRLEVSYLQHNMSSQTFKADMAVGSWVDTPLRPGIMDTVKIVEKRIERRGGCRAECESDPDCEDDYRAWCWIQQWVNTYIQ
jgi:hypothetical protein